MKPVPLLAVLLLAFGCSHSHVAPAQKELEVAASESTSADPQTPSPQRIRKPAPRPVEAIERVLIISIDGLRPDLALRAYMPRVRELCGSGSFTFWAETTPEAYTLPAHVSMLTGASSEKHGVTWNDYIEESYPNVPTLFEIAKAAGYSTAMVAGKMKFIVFTRPGALDHYYLPPEEPVSDLEVAQRAAGLLRQHRPQVMFVHLPGVDTAGHEFGWGSAKQVRAIEQADKAVALVLNVLEELKLTDSTLMILTADHGGAGKDHVAKDARSHFIPWIAAGPGLREDFDLTLKSKRRIGIEDTFATACAFLGLERATESTGKPVLEVLKRH